MTWRTKTTFEYRTIWQLDTNLPFQYQTSPVFIALQYTDPHWINFVCFEFQRPYNRGLHNKSDLRSRQRRTKWQEYLKLWSHFYLLGRKSQSSPSKYCVKGTVVQTSASYSSGYRFLKITRKSAFIWGLILGWIVVSDLTRAHDSTLIWLRTQPCTSCLVDECWPRFAEAYCREQFEVALIALHRETLNGERSGQGVALTRDGSKVSDMNTLEQNQ